MQTVHYSIYLPAAAETITLSSVSKEVTQLEDKITKSIPSMLVNSSFIERINEIEKRILPIDDTHLRNITLNLKVFLISSWSDEHRCLWQSWPTSSVLWTVSLKIPSKLISSFWLASRGSRICTSNWRRSRICKCLQRISWQRSYILQSSLSHSIGAYEGVLQADHHYASVLAWDWSYQQEP